MIYVVYYFILTQPDVSNQVYCKYSDSDYFIHIANDEPLVAFPDNLLGISWVDSGWVPILNPGNVLDYFSERSNPFYDRTCNNEVVKMQRLTLEHLKYA